MATTVFTRGRWAIGLSATLTGIAMLLYPGGTPLDPSSRGYSFFHNFLSDLGTTVALGGRPNLPGSLLFVVSLVMLVVALGACLVAFIRLYSVERVPRLLARAAGIVGALVCAGFIGVALTPEDRFMPLHLQFTLFAFRAFPLASLLLALAAVRNEYVSRRAAVAWMALTAVLVGYVIVLDWGPRVTTEDGLMVQVTAQKIVSAAALLILAYQCYEADRVAARRSQPAT